MKTAVTKIKRGFTLVELSIVMMVGIMVGTMVIALFNQQIAFLKVFRAQSFLAEEAPMCSLYVSSIVGKADRYRLHDSVADALTGSNPRLTPTSVVLLNFRQPDGSMRASILSFEDRGEGDGPALYYYVVPELGVLDDPEWAVTTMATDVQFSMDQGILRTRLTGPAGEQITYSGTMQ